MCSPRVDAHPFLAELLGGPKAGFFAARPIEPAGNPVQRYVDDSMVLETAWDGVCVTDYLDCSEGLPAEPPGRTRLIRVLTGTGRAVIEFAPRFGRIAGSLLEPRGDDLVVSAGSRLGGDQVRRLWLRNGSWMAVDRGVALAESAFNRPVPEWEFLRDTIAAEILTEGWNPEEGAFTAAYGSTDLDSAVLAVGLSGLVPPEDPRLAATIDAIEAQLRVGPTVYRYRGDDGLPGKASGFNLMTSWLIDSKILIGDLDGARALFDDYAALAGPTGLMSEEYDPVTGQARGNFPQAYSHLGLIENALNLAEHTDR